MHFDHFAPTHRNADRNGDGQVNNRDVCASTSDDTMMHKGRRDTGPGVISIDGDMLTFSIGMAELGLELGAELLIWGDTKGKGVRDRAPTTEAGDGCEKPEVDSEVLSLMLTDDAVCPCADAWTQIPRSVTEWGAGAFFQCPDVGLGFGSLTSVGDDARLVINGLLFGPRVCAGFTRDEVMSPDATSITANEVAACADAMYDYGLGLQNAGVSVAELMTCN